MRALFDLLWLPVETTYAELATHLDAGGDPRAHDNTPLRWACRYGHLDLLERLIELGLDANDARMYNCEALRWAYGHGHLAVVVRLIALGLDGDDARAVDNDALHWACENGHLAVVERLLDLGLTADDARADDDHALHLACINNHHSVAARLLELGVEPTPAALRSLTAYACEYACEYDEDDRDDRLRRAVERWRDTPALEAAEDELEPAELDAWAVARPSRLRFAD